KGDANSGELTAVVLSDDLIRELAAFKGVTAPVTSCYLDIDGRRYVRAADYEVELDRMLRRARETHPNSQGDLKAVEDHVKQGIDRSHVRGLAMFSCLAHDFW